MLTIEAYIAKRKKEDHLDEWNVECRLDNLKICVNYIFEYFNNYLELNKANEKTSLENEKTEHYKAQIRDYSSEIQNWLVEIYSDYGRYMNRNIGNILYKNSYFYLSNTDSEFRSLSYDCYAQLVKKFLFLQNQTELLFLFIKEYHRIESGIEYVDDFPFISESINDWVETAKTKHQVSILKFCSVWVEKFYDDNKNWPVSHRKKSSNDWYKYEYDYKQKTNLFNLDSLYRDMPKKAFIRGKKQEFEIIMMYYWLNNIEGDKDEYWQEYLEKILPDLEKHH